MVQSSSLSRFIFVGALVIISQKFIERKMTQRPPDFTKGEVHRSYYEEAKQELQERLARTDSAGSAASSVSSTGSLSATLLHRPAQQIPLCPGCKERLKLTASLRDIMRDVKKTQREGYAFCHQCNNSAFQRSDIGMNKKVGYCKSCEIVVCASCCHKLVIDRK